MKQQVALIRHSDRVRERVVSQVSIIPVTVPNTDGAQGLGTQEELCARTVAPIRPMGSASTLAVPRPSRRRTRAGRRPTNPEAERDPAVEAYVAHRRFELHEALEDPFAPVTGPVRDPKSTGITTEPSRLMAWENLNAQLYDGPDRRRLSLDGLWRAEGSPAGKGPLEWIALARPLVPAFHRYFENLAACGYHFEFGCRPFLFIEEEDLDDDHRAGDVTTPLWLIAQAYASMLETAASSDG